MNCTNFIKTTDKLKKDRTNINNLKKNVKNNISSILNSKNFKLINNIIFLKRKKWKENLLINASPKYIIDDTNIVKFSDILLMYSCLSTIDYYNSTNIKNTINNLNFVSLINEIKEIIINKKNLSDVSNKSTNIGAQMRNTLYMYSTLPETMQFYEKFKPYSCESLKQRKKKLPTKPEQHIEDILNFYIANNSADKIFFYKQYDKSENLYSIYNGYKLEFDFFGFIIHNNKIFEWCIEFDGYQHFVRKNHYGSKFNEIYTNDLYKDYFLFENNIHLLRIPYTINISHFKKIIDSFFNSIINDAKYLHIYCDKPLYNMRDFLYFSNYPYTITCSDKICERIYNCTK
jgi:hypothetical protein